MPIVRFKKYPHITLTTPPLKILRPKINNAYFAEAKIEDVEITSASKKKPEIYTVKSGDTLAKIATKKGISVDDIIKSDSEITAATKNDITIGQKITLPTQVSSKETKQKITFTKTKTGTIGSELYVIVETESFQGYNVSINIKQGKEKGIEEQDKAIMLKDDQGDYKTHIITTVGGICDTGYTNKDDFADMAIFKIVIDSSDDTKKKAWTDTLEKATDKKTSLYILVDAHTLEKQEEMNINYFGDTEEGEIRGEKITNRWLDVDGSWFELVKQNLINIYNTGEISKVNFEGLEKIGFLYHDKDGNKHDLGEFDIVEAQKWKKGSKGHNKDWKKVIKSKKTRYYEYDGNKKVKLIKINLPINYNSKEIKINLLDNSSREYINPEAYACLLGALAENGFEDVTLNGFTSKDGTGAPSVTHYNGIAGDLRYLRKDKSGTSLHINTDPKELDTERQKKLINSLIKFGWKSFLSYDIQLDGKTFRLDHTTHKSNHHHHLHLNKGDFKVRYK